MDVVVCVGAGGARLLLSSGGVFVIAAGSRLQGLLGFACTSAAFGDFDNDGSTDMLVASVNTSVIVANNGSGWFSTPIRSFSSAGATIAVDVNADGVLDVPSLSYIATPDVVVSSHSMLFIVVVGRNGRWNQHGARVCVSDTSGRSFGCRVVDSVGANYVVHFGLGSARAVSVDVAFANGHVNNPRTRAAL